MIAWLQPAALWGLLLLAAPMLIHLLRPREARRVPFPTIRFVRASTVASVRVGRPSDPALLAVRLAIVGAAIVALAQPLIVSKSRLAGWDGRMARAIVVDTSASMEEPRPDGRSAAAEASDVAAIEQTSAAAAIQIDSEDLGEGLRRAAAWLRTAPPSRREIVVVSDFAHGSIAAGRLDVLPAGAGLRFVTVGESPPQREVSGVPLLAASGVSPRTLRTHIASEATRVTIAGARDRVQAGIRVIGASATEEYQLLRVVARAGAPAPDAGQPVVFRFPHTDNAGGGPTASLRERWMIQTAIAVEHDAEIARLAREIAAEASAPSGLWMDIVADARGRPLVRAAALGPELMIDVAAQASSYFAAAVVRAALTARNGPIDRPEQEVLRIPAATLSAWSRPAGPVGTTAWQHADTSDARWCWAAALALLGLEQRLRRRNRASIEEQRAAA